MRARRREEGQETGPRPCVRRAELQVAMRIGALPLAEYLLCSVCGPRRAESLRTIPDVTITVLPLT